MHLVIAWSGFLGAWLLVAGPIYQAAIELEEENVERDTLAAASATVEPPRRVSPWWWLIPPVAYVLLRRRGERYRRLVLAALSPDTIEQLIRFGNKATGWLLVALGAFFIAVKETWELIEAYEAPGWTLAIGVVLMVLACAVFTVVRQRRTHVLLGDERPPR